MTGANRNELHARGKSVKTASEIRILLLAIHDANPPKPTGPYRLGLPREEIAPVQPVTQCALETTGVETAIEVRDREFYRRLLLDKSALSGAMVGGFLGANFGTALCIALHASVAIPLAIGACSGIGCLLGVAVAQSAVIRNRVDLFGVLPNKLAVIWR